MARWLSVSKLKFPLNIFYSGHTIINRIGTISVLENNSRRRRELIWIYHWTPKGIRARSFAIELNIMIVKKKTNITFDLRPLLRSYSVVTFVHIFWVEIQFFAMVIFSLASLVFLWKVRFQVCEKTKIAHKSLIKARRGLLKSFMDFLIF